MKNIIQPMFNYSQILSQTPICPDLNVIQDVNKITLKVWSNAFPIGNIYSYLQVLKATSKACPDHVMISSTSIRKSWEKRLKINLQMCKIKNTEM